MRGASMSSRPSASRDRTAARVSSQTSHPFGEGNLRPGPFVQKDRGLTVVYTTSGLSRWPDGGDYIGLTADGDGACFVAIALGRQPHTAEADHPELHQTRFSMWTRATRRPPTA